jgi:hypothetical protein
MPRGSRTTKTLWGAEIADFSTPHSSDLPHLGAAFCKLARRIRGGDQVVGGAIAFFCTHLVIYESENLAKEQGI